MLYICKKYVCVTTSNRNTSNHEMSWVLGDLANCIVCWTRDYQLSEEASSNGVFIGNPMCGGMFWCDPLNSWHTTSLPVINPILTRHTTIMVYNGNRVMLCWEELSNQKPNYLEKKSRKHPTFFTLFIYRIAQAKRTHLGFEWKKKVGCSWGTPQKSRRAPSKNFS